VSTDELSPSTPPQAPKDIHPHPSTPEPSARRRSPVLAGLSDLLKTGLLALVVFFGARLVILPYQVDGRSMTPNLQDRERVLVNRAVYLRVDLDRLVGWVPGVDLEPGDLRYPFHAPARGDVVVLNPPEYSDEPYIKRVVGVAGDTVSFRDGYVYIDGERLDEPYLDGPITDCDGDDYCGGYIVPAGNVFVLGDNRGGSLDSRAFGPVPLDHIIGEAWLVNWPLDKVGLIPS